MSLRKKISKFFVEISQKFLHGHLFHQKWNIFRKKFFELFFEKFHFGRSAAQKIKNFLVIFIILPIPYSLAPISGFQHIQKPRYAPKRCFQTENDTFLIIMTSQSRDNINLKIFHLFYDNLQKITFHMSHHKRLQHVYFSYKLVHN